MNFLCFDPSISVERRLYSVTPSSLCIKFGVVWFFLSDILQFIQPTFPFPRYPSTEWIVPFRERVRGLCVVVYIEQNHDSTRTSNVFCRKIDGSGSAEGKAFQLQTLENGSFWKNEEVTNRKLKVGCILEYQSQTRRAESRGRYIELFFFCRNVCCERKVNFYYYINSTVVSWFLRNLHCPCVLRPPLIDLDPHPPPPLQNFSVSICSSSWIHSAFFRVCENLTFHTLLMSNNYSCESPWNMIFFLHVKYIFAYKM